MPRCDKSVPVCSAEAETGKRISVKGQKPNISDNKRSNYAHLCHPLTALTAPTFARCESFSQRETNEHRL